MTSHDDDTEHPEVITGAGMFALPDEPSVEVVGDGILGIGLAAEPQVEVIHGGQPELDDEPQVEVIRGGQPEPEGVGSASSGNMSQLAAPRPQHLVNKATGMALIMASYGDSDATGKYAIGVAPVQDDPALNWMIEWVGDNVVQLRHTQYDAMLDSNTDRQVYGLTPNGGSYQKWYAAMDGEGFWTFKNYATGFMLDSGGQDVVYTHAPNDGAFQRWGLSDA